MSKSPAQKPAAPSPEKNGEIPGENLKAALKKKTGRPKGTPKTGGRKKPGPNPYGKAGREYLAEHAGHLDLLIRILNGKGIKLAGPTGKPKWWYPDKGDVLWALDRALQRTVPVLQAQEISGPEGGPIQSEDLTPIGDLELARQIDSLLYRVDHGLNSAQDFCGPAPLAGAGDSPPVPPAPAFSHGSEPARTSAVAPCGAGTGVAGAGSSWNGASLPPSEASAPAAAELAEAMVRAGDAAIPSAAPASASLSDSGPSRLDPDAADKSQASEPEPKPPDAGSVLLFHFSDYQILGVDQGRPNLPTIYELRHNGALMQRGPFAGVLAALRKLRGDDLGGWTIETQQSPNFASRPDQREAGDWQRPQVNRKRGRHD